MVAALDLDLEVIEVTILSIEQRLRFCSRARARIARIVFGNSRPCCQYLSQTILSGQRTARRLVS